MSDTTEQYSKHEHRKDLTFRQAEKIDPLPKMLAYGQLSRDLRNEIWDVLYLYFSGATDHREWPSSFSHDAFMTATLYLREVKKYPLDEARAIARDPAKFVKHLKGVIFESEYYDCLECALFFMRLPIWSKNGPANLSAALNDPTSPYMVVDFPPMTIIPRGNENEQEAFKGNWAIIKASTLEGAKTHLQESADALNAANARAAIREAVHAVESAAKVITGNDTATLDDALKLLEKDKALHPALRKAFSSLYGYTNDEKGIRHALIEGDNANAGQDEALFMFSACTAFVAYLARKFPEKA